MDFGLRALSSKSKDQKPKTKSIHLCNFNPRVIRLKNLFVTPSLPGKSVCTNLAHTDAMTPAASGEDKLRYASIVIKLAVDHKKLFLQTQRRADSPAADVRGSIGANNFQIGYSM